MGKTIGSTLKSIVPKGINLSHIILIILLGLLFCTFLNNHNIIEGADGEDDSDSDSDSDDKVTVDTVNNKLDIPEYLKEDNINDITINIPENENLHVLKMVANCANETNTECNQLKCKDIKIGDIGWVGKYRMCARYLKSNETTDALNNYFDQMTNEHCESPVISDTTEPDSNSVADEASTSKNFTNIITTGTLDSLIDAKFEESQFHTKIIPKLLLKYFQNVLKKNYQDWDTHVKNDKLKRLNANGLYTALTYDGLQNKTPYYDSKGDPKLYSGGACSNREYCTKNGLNNTYESGKITDLALQAVGLCEASSGASFWGKGYDYISAQYDNIKFNATKDIKNPFLMKCS